MRLPLALRLAGRELRGGIGGLRIFLACLALGVGVIAAVGSLSAAIETGLDRNARALLGGDVEFMLVHRHGRSGRARFSCALGARCRRWRRCAAWRSRATARTAAWSRSRRSIAPIRSTARSTLAPARPLDQALAERDGHWGAVVAPALLDRLGIKPGDLIRIGDALLVVRARLEHEPDGISGLIEIGPRVLVAARALDATGLLQPGVLINYSYRARLPPGADPAAMVAAARTRFPDAGWRIRQFANAAPNLKQLLDRLTVFMTLVGLSALLVGGVGVGNAVAGYLAGKTETIATLKCLGASRRLVSALYLAEIMALALVGIALGLGARRAGAVRRRAAAAAATPGDAAVRRLCDAARHRRLLRAADDTGLRPVADRRGGRGAAGAAVPRAGRDGAGAAIGRRSWPPLSRRRCCWPCWPWRVRRTGALRPGRWSARRRRSSCSAWPVRAWWRRHAGPGGRAMRRCVSRSPISTAPARPTASVLASLGLGLALLVAIVLVEGNVAREIDLRLPERAPSFFFIDIQPDQVAAFDALLTALPGVTEEARVPSLRGRITRIDGVPVERATVASDARWAIRSDRGLTYAATLPAGSRVVAGSWWPEDYHGPPLVSFDEDLARGMGLTDRRHADRQCARARAYRADRQSARNRLDLARPQFRDRAVAGRARRRAADGHRHRAHRARQRGGTRARGHRPLSERLGDFRQGRARQPRQHRDGGGRGTVGGGGGGADGGRAGAGRRHRRGPSPPGLRGGGAQSAGRDAGRRDACVPDRIRAPGPDGGDARGGGRHARRHGSCSPGSCTRPGASCRAGCWRRSSAPRSSRSRRAMPERGARSAPRPRPISATSSVAGLARGGHWRGRCRGV